MSASKNPPPQEPVSPAAPLSIEEVYLMEYLREEFRNHPEIRIRRLPHEREPGISVRSEAREYFFPLEWALRKDYAVVRAEIERIKEALGL